MLRNRSTPNGTYEPLAFASQMHEFYSTAYFNTTCEHFKLEIRRDGTVHIVPKRLASAIELFESKSRFAARI